MKKKNKEKLLSQLNDILTIYQDIEGELLKRDPDLDYISDLNSEIGAIVMEIILPG
jgi:hypothetical protein